METNVLYYRDNLDILGRYIPYDSVDLVYLDPPFNSNRDYSVIFKDESGRNSDAQLLAFEDTWHSGPEAEESYRYLTNSAAHGGQVSSQVSQIVAALRAGIGTKNSSMIRDLKGTLEREKAAIGLLLTLEEATEPMRQEAATAGAYHSDLWNRDYPRLQILTIREPLEEHRKPLLPPFVLPTYEQAHRIKSAPKDEQAELFG